jgi:cysteine desulfurase
MKKAYLDYAATTPVDARVLKAMLPYFSKKYGNPSSIHIWGQEVRSAIEEAREKIASLLECSSREIYFTGTTTTSDNLAIQGVMKAAQKKGLTHLITSAVEHHAVLDTCLALEKQGFMLTILGVDKFGQVRTEDLKKALTPKTALVSVMLANNEVGTIQPIKELASMLKPPALFHTDAAAAAEYLEIRPAKLGVDLLTLGAHKFGGPKGVGLLYLRREVAIKPITYGGHHEAGLWPGTEAVPLIIGMAKALEIALTEKAEAQKRVTKLRDKLIKGVLAKIRGAQLTGHPQKRLPDIASFIFEGVEGEAVLLALSDLGIAASSGSACTSGILKPSHVLTAMGYSSEQAHGSIRFSLGKATIEKEIDYVLSVLPKVINRLRSMAPK